VVTNDLAGLLGSYVHWYAKKGKTAKRLSNSARVVALVAFSIALVFMAVGGAGAPSAIAGIVGGVALLADRLLGFTRNWTEFSYLEIRLTNALALVNHYTHQNADGDALMEFRKVIAEVEKETLGWQEDVRQGLQELKKSLADQGTKKPLPRHR
jgi:hypothetical protein